MATANAIELSTRSAKKAMLRAYFGSAVCRKDYWRFAAVYKSSASVRAIEMHQQGHRIVVVITSYRRPSCRISLPQLGASVSAVQANHP